MKFLAVGIWDLSDQTLDRIGRGACRLLGKRTSRRENAAYAIAGGALVFSIFGAVVGFAVSDPWGSTDAINGALLGGLLGMCMGILVAAFVVMVDTSIKSLIASLDSRNSK